MNIIAVDIGNSRIKALCGNNYFSSDYHSGGMGPAAEFIKSNIRKGTKTGICSVNEDARKSLVGLLVGTEDLELTYIPGEIDLERHVKTAHLHGFGNDRATGLVGALSMFAPPLITVDCGTAITINAVDRERRCIGGAIMPGIYTQIHSLESNTYNLNSIVPEFENPVIGKDTAGAINFGVVAGACGAIREILGQIMAGELSNSDTRIIMTGGYGYKLNPHLEKYFGNIIYDELLILKGVAFLLS